VKYRLLYTRRAAKDIQSLDENIKQRIGRTLLRYSDEPLKRAQKLSDPGLGTYRFRVGEYRVIFDLEGSDIVILRVGHRREIHRRP
jgi:mRNA interferase RelE/StbE